MASNPKLELTWIGKENRPNQGPRILNNRNVRGVLDNSGIKPEELPSDEDIKKLEIWVKSTQ